MIEVKGADCARPVGVIIKIRKDFSMISTARHGIEELETSEFEKLNSNADLLDKAIDHWGTASWNGRILQVISEVSSKELYTGLSVSFMLSATNPENATIKLDGLDEKTLLNSLGESITVGTLTAGQIYTVTYDGTAFRINDVAHATSADTAKNADEATHAEKADSATSADNAQNAVHADSSDSAKTSDEALHATRADSSVNADNATTADTAKKADEATHAVQADSAITAANADNATHATTADSAATATNADTADNYTADGSIAVEFDAQSKSINNLAGDGRTIETVKGNADAIANLNAIINSDRINQLLMHDIKGTTQYPTITDGQVIRIDHKNGTAIIRSDVFSYAENLITEVRTLNTGDMMTFKYHLDSLNTEVI
jgi:hypothetical protein